MYQSSHNKIALFVDLNGIEADAAEMEFAHCAMSHVWARPLIQEIEDQLEGWIQIRRAYGNIIRNTERYVGTLLGNASTYCTPKYIQKLRDALETDKIIQRDLYEHGFQFKHVLDVHPDTNPAITVLMTDCMDTIVQSDQIDTVALAVNDSDYLPLIQWLRSRGKAVALITVGMEGKSKTLQLLSTLTNHHVAYDQALIDKFSAKILRESIERIVQDDISVLRDGLPIATVMSRINSDDPDFKVSDLGFSSSVEFIECCIEPPYRLINQSFIGHEEASIGEIIKTTKEIAQQSVLKNKNVNINSEQPKSKIQNIESILRRPSPKARADVMHFIENRFPGGKINLENGDLLTFTGLKELLFQNLADQGQHARSQLNEALRQLAVISLLLLEPSNAPLKEKIIKGYDFSGAIDALANFYVRRISGEGIALSHSEIPVIAKMLFGSEDSKYQAAIRLALNNLNADRGMDRTVN